MGEPRTSLLFGALDCDDAWVRMGAALTLANAGDYTAVPALKQRWLKTESPQDEFWIIALALERLNALELEPISEALGFPETSELEKTFLLSWDPWVYYWRDRTLKPTRVAENVLSEVWRRYLRNKRAKEYPALYSEEPEEEFPELYYTLKGKLSWLEILYDRPNEKKYVAKLINPVLDLLSSRDQQLHEKAIQEVARIVLTDPEKPVRDELSGVLATSGDHHVRDQLFQGLFGYPAYLPSDEQIRHMRRAAMDESAEEAIDDRIRLMLGPSFAADALEQFTDPESSWRIAEVAVRADPITRARAEEILFSMDCDISLPALFWITREAANEEEANAARLLLRAIVARHLQYDISLWRISGKLFATDLSWVVTLLERLESKPQWSAEFAADQPFGWSGDRTTTQLLLRNAIRTIPLREPSHDVLHYTMPAWERFKGKSRTIFERFRSLTTSPTAGKRRYSAKASVPDTCVLGVDTALQVEFRLVGPDDRSADGQFVTADNEKSLELLVFAHSKGFAITPPYLPLRLGAEDDWRNIKFGLIGTKLGRHLIEVQILKGIEQVAYLHLESTVLEASNQQHEGVAQSTPHLLEVMARDYTRATIEIDWKSEGLIEFTLWDAATLQVPPQKFSKNLTNMKTPQQVREWMAGFTSRLRDYVTYFYKNDQELAEGKLAICAIGLDIYQQLIPQGLAEAVRTWPSGSVIGIWSNEAWIPWELLCHDIQLGLWGEYFQIMRLPRKPSEDAAEARTNLEKVSALEPGSEVASVASIIGDAIPVGEHSGGFSAVRTFPRGIRVTPAREPTVSDLAKLAAETDILHLTCHGRHDEKGASFYLSLGPDLLRRLFPDRVPTITLKPGVLVFANACSSGQPLLSFGEFVSFGWRFYDCGARPFIGTLGAVPVGAALELAERFYHYFLTEGFTAGRALREARQEAERKHRNPFGALYCLYGPASTRRRLPMEPLGEEA